MFSSIYQFYAYFRKKAIISKLVDEFSPKFFRVAIDQYTTQSLNFMLIENF